MGTSFNVDMTNFPSFPFWFLLSVSSLMNVCLPVERKSQRI